MAPETVSQPRISFRAALAMWLRADRLGRKIRRANASARSTAPNIRTRSTAERSVYICVMNRSFRFGYQLSGNDVSDPVAAAVGAEGSGFDTVLMSDHVGTNGSSPMVTLGAIAQATSTIRLGTFVLNSDMRNPVQLAWEASTLDRLSGGRFELGLGAGHTPQEYSATGTVLDVPRVRKERLMEGVEVIRRLVDGKTVTFEGRYVRVHDAVIDPALQARLPILVGGNGATLLAHAGAHADIVGLQGLGRTQADGHSHQVKWTTERLDDQIDQIRSGACDRFDDLELNAMVQWAEITDDYETTLEQACNLVPGLTAEQATKLPYLLFGTVDEIVAKLHECRDRWGITYFVVRERLAFAEVIRKVRNSAKT